MTTKALSQGTHRTRSLEETRARIWPHLRTMGITRVANITGLDNIGIAVAVACRPNSRGLSGGPGKGLVVPRCRSLGGNGVDRVLSRRAHHSAATAGDLGANSRFSHPAIDPALLPKSAVGRFRNDLKVHWLEGFDLLQSRTCWVPYELVHTDFTLPLPSDSGCFPLSSNGLASGNHPYEAISHGLCELIERDAEALFACGAAHAQRRRVGDARFDRCA